jgi:UDP-glucose 4-epimerase
MMAPGREDLKSFGDWCIIQTMKVLITGGAGFIGSHLLDRLIEEGDEVYVIDDLSTGKAKNIEHHLGNKRFHFINDSILNEKTTERLISQVEIVYHLAALVGVKYVVEDPLRAILTNVRGTETVLNLAYKYGKKTILASSSEVYGKSTKVPLAEEDDRILGPTSVGRWSYSSSKAIDEYIAFAYAEMGLPIVILRYFNSYGPRLDPAGYGSVIARFITQALSGEPITVYGDGKQTRCFTYVEDTVRGTLLASTSKEAEGEVFNIGYDREITILELAEKIKKLTNSPSEIVLVPYDAVYGPNFEDPYRRVPDVSKAERILGFRARVSLEEGLHKTIEWFKENA